MNASMPVLIKLTDGKKMIQIEEYERTPDGNLQMELRFEYVNLNNSCQMTVAIELSQASVTNLLAFLTRIRLGEQPKKLEIQSEWKSMRLLLADNGSGWLVCRLIVNLGHQHLDLDTSMTCERNTIEVQVRGR